MKGFFGFFGFFVYICACIELQFDLRLAYLQENTFKFLFWLGNAKKHKETYYTLERKWSKLLASQTCFARNERV